MAILDWFKRKPKTARHYSKLPRRGFDAASGSRLFQDWTTSSYSSTEELKYTLAKIRARSRDLFNNNDYARRFIELCKTNIAGPQGIQLQVRATEDNGSPDKVANQIIESEFSKWGKACSVDGRLSWVDAQKLFVETVARDGECLIRLVRGYNNPYGFAIQFIEADHLDETFNEELKSDNKIEMSVEMDKFRHPTAYHLLVKPPNGIALVRGNDRQRVPASEILHGYVVNRPNQVRGVPWAVTAMSRLHMLGAYEQSELVAARVASAKMGFFTSPDGDGYMGEDVTEGYTPLMESEPGSFEQLPAGMSFQTFDPDHPTTAFKDFEKAMLRGISSGLNVSYASLSNDLESVNYSSIRQGSLDERDHWRSSQRWLIDHFCRPIYEAWLEEALARQAVPLPVRKRDKWASVDWHPRGWQWIDPQKEVAANVEAVKNGFKSLADVMAEQGRDPFDTLSQLAAEKELADALGLNLQLGNATERQPTDEGESDNGDT
uniref:Bacteriophage capsid protein n=1 Tax=uncultured nuHF2 cluster bacterium HF0770_42C12 TaxID=723593 RepID=E7C7Y5_9BACT|nr:bacteriophage capsid protein [uncultured nuHF2 cluster bacterium HF0770_42C12]